MAFDYEDVATKAIQVPKMGRFEVFYSGASDGQETDKLHVYLADPEAERKDLWDCVIVYNGDEFPHDLRNKLLFKMIDICGNNENAEACAVAIEGAMKAYNGMLCAREKK